MIQLLNELKITKGETLTISANIGNFKKGDKVTVTQVNPNGDDVEIHLRNKKGIKDVFYMDESDNFDDLTS